MTKFFVLLPKRFGLSVLQVSHTIPMSIYVAIEVLKLIQKHLIETDECFQEEQSMDYENIKYPVKVRNPNLIENLGEIDLLLTDKTGTLTSNNMRIKSIYCDNKIFGVEGIKASPDLIRRIDAAKNLDDDSIELIKYHLEH